MHAVVSGTLADQGQSLPELITEESDTAFEQQQDLRLTETFLEDSDGYVDVVADDAEPMAMTRGMVIMLISCREKKMMLSMILYYTTEEEKLSVMNRHLWLNIYDDGSS
jgi:hypothetical protein